MALVIFRSVWILSLVKTRFLLLVVVVAVLVLVLVCFFFFFLSQLQEIEEEKVGEQVVSGGGVCNIPAKTEKGKGKVGGLCSLF